MEAKTVLITGASGGLGKRFANALKDKGYNLALHYFENPLEEQSGNAKSYYADISAETDVKSMVSKIISDFGSVDILINNAGISMDAVSWKMPIETWNKVLAVNLTGTFLCIKHTLPFMREKNFGRIINISSVVAETGVSGTVAYSASKSGIFGLTKTVAREVANKNITVNTIALGYFNEGMISQVPENLKSKIISTIPKNELGDTLDIINCINYLIDDNSRYITGQVININGGLY